jgi:hypothetical protein
MGTKQQTLPIVHFHQYRPRPKDCCNARPPAAGRLGQGRKQGTVPCRAGPGDAACASALQQQDNTADGSPGVAPFYYSCRLVLTPQSSPLLPATVLTTTVTRGSPQRTHRPHPVAPIPGQNLSRITVCGELCARAPTANGKNRLRRPATARPPSELTASRTVHGQDPASSE